MHEDLEDAEFSIPSGIIQLSVCSRSGKLPIEGLCDAHVKTEYYAMSNMPTEICDLHYTGPICNYEGNSIASPECPFQYIGGCELPLIEDESLWEGSTIPVEQPDGSILYVTPDTSNVCQHDANFFLNPDYPNILAAQQAELNARILAAQLAAEQAALQAQQAQ